MQSAIPKFRDIEIPQFRKPTTAEKSFTIPAWQCFCCQDTGIVSVNAIKQLINPAYDVWTHPAIACNRRGCFKEAPKYAIELLTSSECESIHEWARQGWLDTAKKWAENPDQHGQVVARVTEFLGAPATAIPPEPDYLDF